MHWSSHCLLVSLLALVEFGAALRRDFAGGHPRAASTGSDKFLREPKIVGGYQVSDSYSMPWIVSLRDSSKFHFCGGTVVAPNVVLTAAHCIATKPDLPWWDNRFPLVAVGNRGQANDGQEQENFFQPALTIMHSGFNAENITDDIALLFFKEDLVDANGDSGIVTLPDANHKIEDGKTGITYGWGLLGEDESLPTSQLYGVETTMYTLEMCRKESLYEPGSLLDGMFCGGGDLGEDGLQGGLDACSGDSGGPYLDYGGSSDASSPLQVGIVSWGVGCGRQGYPGVYVELANYVDWIAQQLEFVESLKPSLSCFSATDVDSNNIQEVGRNFGDGFGGVLGDRLVGGVGRRARDARGLSGEDCIQEGLSQAALQVSDACSIIRDPCGGR